jgi:serine O-acetyltransferase
VLKELREDVNALHRDDPAARSRTEVLLAYQGLHALFLHRIAHRLWRSGARLIARILSNLNRFFTGVEIHPAARIGRRVAIDHGAGVVIGETAEVGDDCVIYQGVTLGGVNLRPVKRHPTIGRKVVVGAGAKVLGAINVGDGARIGANAVVVDDVPPGAIAIGVPARAAGTKEKKARLHFDHYNLPDPLRRHLEEIHRRVDKLEGELAVLRVGDDNG